MCGVGTCDLVPWQWAPGLFRREALVPVYCCLKERFPRPLNFLRPGRLWEASLSPVFPTEGQFYQRILCHFYTAFSWQWLPGYLQTPLLTVHRQTGKELSSSFDGNFPESRAEAMMADHAICFLYDNSDQWHWELVGYIEECSVLGIHNTLMNFISYGLKKCTVERDC